MVAMVTGFLEKIWSNDSWRFIYVCGKFHSATINQTVFGKEFVKLVWENINYFEPPWKYFFCNFYSQLVSSTSDIARPIMFNLPWGTRWLTALALFKLTSRSSLLVRVKSRHLKPLTSHLLLGQLGALLKKTHHRAHACCYALAYARVKTRASSKRKMRGCSQSLDHVQLLSFHWKKRS